MTSIQIAGPVEIVSTSAVIDEAYFAHVFGKVEAYLRDNEPSPAFTRLLLGVAQTAFARRPGPVRETRLRARPRPGLRARTRRPTGARGVGRHARSYPGLTLADVPDTVCGP